MRARSRPDYLYVARCGVLMKIGISSQPVIREYQLDATIIKLYRRPWAPALERAIKGILRERCVRGSEWFDVDEQEMLEVVRRTVRVGDDDEAIKRGVAPSPRPTNGIPVHQPPAELGWL